LSWVLTNVWRSPSLNDNKNHANINAIAKPSSMLKDRQANILMAHWSIPSIDWQYQTL